ncbi:hypothetical protein OA801_22855 [Citrobacter portucalensis]|nr:MULTISPECIES: hypothetical protein [Citrobacter]MDG9958789.1 hypothetical protein [Citrobacter portucalensis]MDM2883341.1 hypothetical protein [Citrobacter sp. Cpo044]MDN4359861.1 hypothetical protein [Citrobacter portucalensis]MDN4366058.1 hypothetical protein [Citrobacter portucalensis]MDN4376544.1 hypothetical protein [Citrobacter portucalensis]
MRRPTSPEGVRPGNVAVATTRRSETIRTPTVPIVIAGSAK